MTTTEVVKLFVAFLGSSIFGHDKPSKSNILLRQAEMKTTHSALLSSLLSARYFLVRPMNHTASLETDNRVREKKTVPYLENIYSKEASTV